MYISSLVLHGFKSFGQRTTLTFGEGITAVVGPNGCGKTNIVDGLRWVLGEQKQSVLRSSRMEEVIFHGSRNHKPSSISEVTLAIHNSKAKLPLEYTDIEVSRRLYRDGESEYLINRNPCRLKDIMELFMDTGMGSDAYSVIELNMIEAILSDVEDDRRRMFEEAAGINKYKKQRRSAQRKLEATSQDLERVNDIIGEVDSQVRALGLQLKRFERHERLSAALKGRELALARLQIKDLARETAPLREALAAGRDSRQAEAALIARDEERLGQLQVTCGQREHELGVARQSLSQATGELHELKEKQLVWGEQLRSARRSRERFEQERESESQREVGYQSEIAKLEEQLQALGPKLEQLRQVFEARRAEEEAIVGEYQRGEQHLQAVRERRFNHRHLIQEEEARCQRVADMAGEKRQELTRLDQDIAERSESRESLAKQGADGNRRQRELETRLAELMAERGKLAAQRQDLDEQESGVRDEQRQLTTQTQVLQSRLEIFAELVESHEGYPSGTKAVLADMSRFPGVLGVVAELAAVKPVHALAVETALGPFAPCLVTETVDQARQLLAQADQEGLGRLSVIPLDRIESGEEGSSKPELVPAVPLMELVRVPDKLIGLYRRLLAGFYWAEAGASLEDLPPGVTVVTAEGHLFGAVPFLTHGGQRSSSLEDTSATQGSTVIVGRSGEMDRLRQAIAETTQQTDALDARLAEIQAQRSDLAQQCQLLEEEGETAAGEANQLGRDLSRLEYELQRTTDDVKALKSQVAALKDSIRGLEDNLAAHDKVLEHLREQETSLEADIRQAEIDYQEVRTKRDAWQGEMQESRVELLTVENQRENLAGRRLSVADALVASTKRIAQLEADSDEARQDIEDLTRRLVEAEQRRTALEKDVNDRQSACDEKEAAVREVREQITGLEEQIRQRQHSREAALSQYQELELRLSDLGKQEELIRSRIQEVYHEEVAAGEDVGEQVDEGALRAAIERLRASLERIGPINMAVAEEYAEESKRLKFLTEQRDDLLEAEESLGKTIRRIDRQARDQFRDTYDKIRHHFKQTFRLFFEGGEGDLRLVGDPDPLEADIEIIAQPPGKKTRSLRALSGGEKALTAIALLFAIYMVKPSPFCILDEVDAPLDDANIGKFTKVIKQFAKDTQFIVVTHNKLTMENADYLYGVTMAEEGLSNLVSVNLGEYAR
ncbi:MAG: chromosome segregation protein SMC [Candidatus Neomarinimicrobiota bacterium]